MEGVATPDMKVKVYKDRKGEWRWRLTHRNGNKIANSGEGYKRRDAARRAFASIFSAAIVWDES